MSALDICRQCPNTVQIRNLLVLALCAARKLEQGKQGAREKPIHTGSVSPLHPAPLLPQQINVLTPNLHILEPLYSKALRNLIKMCLFHILRER
jgi:hypothetical protein